MIDVFLAFVLACQPGADGPGKGHCKVSPPNVASQTMTLCQADVDALKKAYADHPELEEFSKIGGRLFFGCFKTDNVKGIPSATDVVKEIRK